MRHILSRSLHGFTQSDVDFAFSLSLMELFMLGISNYTETDIKETARALTSWRVDLTTLNSYSDERYFDNSEKIFLGKIGNFNYEDIVNIIFSKDAASKFTCRK